MKILCFIDSLGSGGAQRQMVELAKGFKEKGHEVSFLIYHDIYFFKPELDKFNIPVETIIEANYVKRLFKIRKVIRKHKPDALLSFLEAANLMATVAGFPYRQWKLVVGERSAKPIISNTIRGVSYRALHLFVDCVVSNSVSNINAVFKANPLLPKSKTRVIYNIVNIDKFSPVKLASFNERINIVVAASYQLKKNLDGLIEALQLLPKCYKSKLKVNWYGNNAKDNTYYQDQKENIEQYNLSDVLTLNDETNEINLKYANADFIGLFSHYEGFPNTICEAMAMGKPVIVSKVSDVPLFVKEDENGFLCESDNPESIKKALIYAINSTKPQRLIMGARNFDVTKKQFNKEVIVDHYLQLLGDER